MYHNRHNNFIQILRILCQRNIQYIFPVHLYLFGIITDIGNQENSRRRNIQTILTIQIGDSPVRRPPLHNIRTDDRFTFFIFDNACDFFCFGRCRGFSGNDYMAVTECDGTVRAF